MLKQRVFHAAWSVLLNPLRAMASTGEYVRDGAAGHSMRLVAPVILSIVGDNPELSLVAGTYNHHEAHRKCQRCLRLTQEMGHWWSQPAE